ncbi:MAG TPA: Hsp20/alpha crystallin family protein [Polyangiaceae bacterium]|nr:Hsp20/alpha crystallin family protein [Polyangiaceae bacterium]
MVPRWNVAECASSVSSVLPSEAPAESAFEPPVDVYEFREAVLIYVEVPGLKPEDIQIGLDGSRLTISGVRRLERSMEQLGFHSIERCYGAFSRSFLLPNAFETEHIEADLRDGVLTVRLPRSPRTRPRPISVQSKPRRVVHTTVEVGTTGETIAVEPVERPKAG